MKLQLSVILFHHYSVQARKDQIANSCSIDMKLHLRNIPNQNLAICKYHYLFCSIYVEKKKNTVLFHVVLRDKGLERKGKNLHNQKKKNPKIFGSKHCIRTIL